MKPLQIEKVQVTPVVPIIAREAQSFDLIAKWITVSALNRFYEKIFKGTILPRQVFDIAGSGPFEQSQVAELIGVMGLDFHRDSEGNVWDEIEVPQPDAPFYIIVGREDFGEEFLEGYLANWLDDDGKPISYFVSQEDFFNYWLFGIEPNYFPGDPRIEERPGLKFLASIEENNWLWPSTEVIAGDGETDSAGWNVEHILRSEFGYTVNKQVGLTERQRQRILDRALQTLTLQEVAEHLAFLVRINKARRQHKSYEEAIAKWERDLAYLRKKYYRKQFMWPPIEP